MRGLARPRVPGSAWGRCGPRPEPGSASPFRAPLAGPLSCYWLALRFTVKAQLGARGWESASAAASAAGSGCGPRARAQFRHPNSPHHLKGDRASLLVAWARPPVGRPERREWCYALLVESEFSWFSKVYNRWAIGFCEKTNYDVYAALSALGCPYLALLLTDFEPLDPLGEVVDSWKEWVIRYERVRRGEAVVRHEYSPGFLVPTGYLHRMSDDYRQELERDALEGGGYAAEHAAAMLAVQRELERFFELVEAGVPGATEIFDRYMGVLSLFRERICVRLLEWKYPEEKLKEWEEMGIGMWRGERFNVELYRPDQVPEKLKRDLIKGELLPLLKDLARVLAPAYFGCVNGVIYVHVP